MIKYTSFYDGVFTCLHNSSVRLIRHFFLIPLRYELGKFYCTYVRVAYHLNELLQVKFRPL